MRRSQRTALSSLIVALVIAAMSAFSLTVSVPEATATNPMPPCRRIATDAPHKSYWGGKPTVSVHAETDCSNLEGRVTAVSIGTNLLDGNGYFIDDDSVSGTTTARSNARSEGCRSGWYSARSTHTILYQGKWYTFPTQSDKVYVTC